MKLFQVRTPLQALGGPVRYSLDWRVSFPEFPDRLFRVLDQKALTKKPIEYLNSNASIVSPDDQGVPLDSVSLVSPVVRKQVYAIGLNYKSHIEETKMETPTYPVVISKAANSVYPHKLPIRIPACAAANEVDFEAELAVVIGRHALNVPKNEAFQYILGYTCANDVTARKWQGAKMGGGQWTRAKSFDTFCPLGPSLRVADGTFNPENVRISSSLKQGADGPNGQFKVMQDARTSDLLFGIADLISFLSQDTLLPPWTVILTGTPSGVGYMRKPPVYLVPGDTVRVEIDGIGTLENPVEANKASKRPESDI